MSPRWNGIGLSRDVLLARAIDRFDATGVIATHLFGSLARGDSDALSDIDLWIIVSDAEIVRLIDNRFDVFNDIAHVVIAHEAPRNRPLGGAYTLVIHRGDDALVQCEYYLAPESKSVEQEAAGRDRRRRLRIAASTAGPPRIIPAHSPEACKPFPVCYSEHERPGRHGFRV